MANVPVLNIGGQDYNIKDAEARIQIDDLKSALDKNSSDLLDGLASKVLKSFTVHPLLTKGKYFDETGWHDSDNTRAASNLIPSGYVTIEVDTVFSTNYSYSTYEYISDSEGNLRYNLRTTNGFTWYIRPFIIVIRRLDGRGMSDEKMSDILSHIIITRYAPEASSHEELIDQFQSIVLGESPINITYTKGTGYFEDGYVSHDKYNCSQIITPATGGERFVIEPTEEGIAAGIYFTVYEYVSDSAGTMIYNTRNTKADHVYNEQFVISARTGSSVTDAIFNALPYYLRVYSYDEHNCKELLEKEKVMSNIVFIGDSIFGMERSDTSVPALVGKYTGAKTYNCALGGTAGSEEPDNDWKWFDFTEISKAIASGNYANQEAHESATGIPSYFSNVIDQLQSIDFSTVDLICVEYGGNDYKHAYCTSSEFIDAMTTNINRILNAYPNIRFVCMTPPYKFFLNGTGEFVNDGDTMENTNGETLRDFVDAFTQISKNVHVMVINAYDELGINRYNRSQWFLPNDGSHPNENGRKEIASLISNRINGMLVK